MSTQLRQPAVHHEMYGAEHRADDERSAVDVSPDGIRAAGQTRERDLNKQTGAESNLEQTVRDNIRNDVRRALAETQTSDAAKNDCRSDKGERRRIAEILHELCECVHDTMSFL